ncbi:MAG: biotin carboxylase [Acidimicrobiaceae bacterium]|jgi:acetyl-CoA carboxylase carboxyltransferase component|nr:biotin carboxylase [Acidimicrobiaceae bacterium]MBT5580301.1 biotin carboxylase [Acidimicrobiaceae bacterium]MBT5851238.1 biotin carboxylase [Acidimicrobiaceae bacterium]
MSQNHAATAPTDCTVVAINVAPGDAVRAGATVAIVEMMKIEHLVTSPVDGNVSSIVVQLGDVLSKGQPILEIAEGPVASAGVAEDAPAPAAQRADLQELHGRRALLTDEARPDAIAKIHARGRRTARENVDDLVDAGTFDEYGGFMYAAQRRRREVNDLMANTPGDGIIGGLGRVNGDLFDNAACAVMSYDYTVLAGTQGFRGHEKKDRLLEIVDRLECPLILFAEGGGGRPGDTDQPWIAGLHLMSFAWMARLSGKVPSIAIVSGRCFAGNAALAAVADVIIATEDANLGMAGPAMIEGGGLGTYAPEDIGPVDVQTENGVIDILVPDDAAAVVAAKHYLSYFQGSLSDWESHDQTAMRDVVPENRKRIYDAREAVTLLSDIDAVLELRPLFGRSIVTALARIEGRPVGIIANDPGHLGGAIDSDSADKASRFMQLCDAHGLPLISLCDTPGFMVGPEAEKTAQVRHFGRMFVTGASLAVPLVSVILRKAVGLGAMAMAGGSFHRNLLSVAWPTGELSGMGIEGAVTLGARRQLEAIEDPDERAAAYDEKVAAMYEWSKALNGASHGEIDDVIDPAETRARIINILRAAPPVSGNRPMIDTW